MSAAKQASNPARLADFLFEAGMLRRIPRSGYQFLGSGGESVAEHSFGAAVAGFVLGRMAGADAEKVAVLCLFHDLHEVRTGDSNYINKRYGTADATLALHDAARGTGLEDPLLAYRAEWQQGETREAVLARDADTLDLLLRVKEELDMGNRYAAEWLERAEKRLHSAEAKELAAAVLAGDRARWWKTAEV